MSDPINTEIAELDANDPLAACREAFDVPDRLIYLDGNSLGPPTRATLPAIQRTAETEWREGLIRSWNKADWIGMPQRCGDKIAKLIGAAAGDVIVCDSVSVNIFKLASAILKNSPGAIVTHENEFPTDTYIAGGLAKQLRLPFRQIMETAGPDALTENDSVLVKSLVHYKTAAVANIAEWESEAAKKNVSIIWDLSHAAGVLNLDVERDGAKFAVGCGYKFLNGGPGAPAFIFIRSGFSDRLDQPLSGWMGHAAPFDFAGDYVAAPGIDRFLCGTPPILSMASLYAALDLFDGISMKAVEEKARRLSDLFRRECENIGLVSDAPPPTERRGAHLCFAHDGSYEIIQALIKRNVVGDFRPPNFMRFGFSPIFLRYADVIEAVAILREILGTEEWRKPEYSVRDRVT